MSRVPYRSILTAALIALAVPGFAQASGYDVIRDCAKDERIDGNYSQGELKDARDNLPTDIDEYSDCRAIINGAINSRAERGGGGGGASGGGGGGAGSGGSSPGGGDSQAARDRDAASLDKLTSDGRKPRLNVAGTDVSPGENGLFDLASAANGMPLPLLLALIVVALSMVAGGVIALNRRFPALAERVPLLSKIRLPRVPLPGLRR